MSEDTASTFSPCSKCRDDYGISYSVNMATERFGAEGASMRALIGNYCLCDRCALQLRETLRMAGNAFLRDEKSNELCDARR